MPVADISPDHLVGASSGRSAGLVRPPLGPATLITSYQVVHKGQPPSKCYCKVGHQSANSCREWCRGPCYKSPDDGDAMMLDRGRCREGGAENNRSGKRNF